MEHLPSIFNELWDFLITPLFEFMIMVIILYNCADKPELLEKTKTYSTKITADYAKIKESFLTPLGINAVTTVGLLILVASVVIATNRFTHFVGDTIPGNLSTFTTFSMVEYSDRNILASIWSTKPHIPDLDNLYRYITEVYSKNIQAYPELAKNGTYYSNELGSVMAYRSFEKFLIVYVILILPILLKRLKIKTKHYLSKAFLCCILILVFLANNFWHHFKIIKSDQFTRVYNCSIILADEISKTKTDSTKIFLSKIEDYERKFKSYGEQPVNITIDR